MTETTDQPSLVAAMVHRPLRKSKVAEDSRLVRAWKIVAVAQGAIVGLVGLVLILLSFGFMADEQDGAAGVFGLGLVILLSAPIAYLVPLTVAVALARSERMAADLAQLASKTA